MKCIDEHTLFLALLFSVLVCAHKHPHFFPNRTTMVHLFEWTWPAIARECTEFLGPRGYAGVQISPPNEARIIATRPWWERYQPISYTLISRSGNENELRDMIERCNRAGVRIYVDIVINHMTGAQTGESIGTAGSKANYDAQQYPAVPYTAEDFNVPCSIQDYQNPTEVRNCQLSSLLDLNQRKPHVRGAIVKFMNRLIDMGVAGFRIDAAKHMWPKDLQAIYVQLRDLKEEFGFQKYARPYLFQEVIDLGGEAIKKTEYNQLGAVTEFKYSTDIGRIFRGKNELKWLRNWGPKWSLLPSKDALVFVDNHDNQRGHGAGGEDILTYKESLKYKMALIFMLAHPYGEVARIMSSYDFLNTDQGPPSTYNGEIIAPTFLPNGQCNTEASAWICEHRWPEIVNMVEFRNIAAGSAIVNWWDNNGNQIAFERQQFGLIAINMELNQEMKLSMKTSLNAGTYCDILKCSKSNDYKHGTSCTGGSYTVRNDGTVEIQLPKGPSAMAIHVGSKI